MGNPVILSLRWDCDCDREVMVHEARIARGIAEDQFVEIAKRMWREAIEDIAKHEAHK